MEIELEKLNGLLYDHGLHEKFQFCYITNGDMESIGLEEFYDFGFSIQVFCSEENFDEEIESIYEADKIDYTTAITMQVERNLKRIAESLNNVVDASDAISKGIN